MVLDHKIAYYGGIMFMINIVLERLRVSKKQ